MTDKNFSKRFIAFGLVTLCFTLLFFRASTPGLNWFIFSLLAGVSVLFAADKEDRLKLLIPSIGLVLSGLAVFIQGGLLPILTTIASFGYLGVAFVAPKVDPGFGALTGILNFIISPFGVIIRFFQRLNTKNGKFKKIVAMLLIPLGLLTFFGILYYDSMPGFKALMDKISWDYFPEILATTLLGIFTSSVLLYCFAPERLNEIYKNLGNKSSNISETLGGDKLSQSWLLGIWTLSILLIVVMLSDLFYNVQETNDLVISYSSNLHKGIYSSIFSILCAAVLSVLTANYISSNNHKSFVISNYVFLFLNMLFILQNVGRNFSYIEQYGLTSKRLVIYLYLIACFVGLVITIYTIAKDKSISFLYTSNAYNVFTILIFSSLINWSSYITTYNLQHVSQNKKTIDFDYLLSLNMKNTGLLMPYYSQMDEDQQRRLNYRINNLKDYKIEDYREWQYAKSKAKSEVKNQTITE